MYVVIGERCVLRVSLTEECSVNVYKVSSNNKLVFEFNTFALATLLASV